MTGRGGLLALSLLVFAGVGPVQAQDAQPMTEAEAGILRWLDRQTGETADIELAPGQEAVSGRLTIRLDSCRYPTNNPTSDAEVHLTIHDAARSEPVFSGWMVASSPGLSALDHPRYDVWALRCVTPPPAAAPDPATSEGEGQ